MAAPTRTIFCPACGRRLKIPSATPEGKKARCGVCETVFKVPAPVEQTRSHDRRRRTGVGQYDIRDLPSDLRHVIGEAPPQPEASPPEPRLDPDTQPDARPFEPGELRRAARKAFDLDTGMTPMRRTGVGVIKLSDLGIHPEDDPPKKKRS